MKRFAFVVLVVASSACASLNKGGSRGPQIQRTAEPAPSDVGAQDKRPELGER